MKILPKKGDLSDPVNHRDIMLLEVAYKIVESDQLKKGLIMKANAASDLAEVVLMQYLHSSKLSESDENTG